MLAGDRIIHHDGLHEAAQAESIGNPPQQHPHPTSPYLPEGSPINRRMWKL